MNELGYKKDVVSRLAGFGWKLQPHEDMFDKFVPDLSFSAHGKDGWIEVKYLPKPPKTLGDIKHYTMGQQGWLIENGRTGSGHCYLLVGTESAHYVWRWSDLTACRGMPWDDAVRRCAASGGIAHVVRAMDAIVRDRGRG